jgi:uncharacterized protein YdaU (DUF1376 family)
MPATVPPQPPAIVAPAPEVKKPQLSVVVQQAPAVAPVSDAALRAAFVQQAGALASAQKTADATKAAAETAARNARWAAILALIGAFFGGVVAWRNGWLQTRTTQQIKHADYRQAWIDKLREELARFTRLAAENDATPAADGKVKESMSVIVLRMDKDDPEYEALTRLMGDVADLSAKQKHDEANTAIAEFLKVSQRILKREWEVTKRDMHTTPWGRPISWFVSWVRRRRRDEEKEIVRRSREKSDLEAPRSLAKPLRWPIQWRTRQKPLVDPDAPVFRIGRLEVKAREPMPTKPRSEVA